MKLEYEHVKKLDLKKWLLGGNTKIYVLILIIAVAAVVFVLKTTLSPDFSPNPNAAVSEKESVSFPNDHEDTSVLSSSPNGETDNTVSTTTPSEEYDESKADPDYLQSRQNYKIKINKSLNLATVYQLDETKQYSLVEKQFRCCVNPNTKIEKTSISYKYTWVRFAYSNHAQYNSKLANGSYLHSVIYYTQNIYHINKSSYNKLGQASDAGYIYFAVADARWIFENCGINTVVEVYEDPDEDNPFAFEEVKPLTTNYDPSDIEAVKGLSDNP